MVVKERLEKLMQNIGGDFSLEKLSKSPARFNLQKLEWFNREYIKLLSLSEFAARASLNKLQISPGIEHKDKDLKYRTGDYLFFTDLNQNKVLCIQDPADSVAFGGRYYLIGGGRKDGETYLENLKREIAEETYDKIQVDETKIIKICSFKAYSPFTYPGEGDFDGRAINIYFYPLKVEEIQAYTLVDGQTHQVDWHDLAAVLEDNQYLNYPVWQDFCNQNNLTVLQASFGIKNQYLAWLLDKNRITKLSEFGTESETILKWKKPTLEEITWKKSTAEQGLKNLQEISSFILDLTDKPETKNLKEALLDFVFSDQVELDFQKTVDYFETEIKNWLTESNKSVGDYLWPLRVCLSGKQKSPSPFELLAVLTNDQIKLRLSSF